MEELLMCSVCIERYHENKRHPVLLPRCGHSFCRPCISMLVNSGCIVCPTCRTDQRIDYVERLPTEYTLLAIINAQEDNKKETCDRHLVKLSFYCRTCGIATCGECLFEDHPTHSHDVIRAAKYIDDMKQNAQLVAVKFIEVLDDREKNYYKIIFNCTKKISNAIRSIGVLRKDMEEARELMKGIKEDESISAATSLSEAAKFLGLKWNIQDANFNRQAKEEKIKDEIELEKERAQEAFAKEEERKAAKEKEKSKSKDGKRVLRKSKTLSAVELHKEIATASANEVPKEKVAENSVKGNAEKTESGGNPVENQLPKTADKTTVKVTNNITDKVHESTAKADDSKTKEMDKSDDLKQKELLQIEEKKNKENIKTELKKVTDSKLKELVKPDEFSIKDIIKMKSLLKKTDELISVEETKDAKDPKSNNKLEMKKVAEAKPKEILKPEEFTIQEILKIKEFLKRTEDLINLAEIKDGKDTKETNGKPDKVPDLTQVKPKAKLPKVKPISKKLPSASSPSVSGEKTQVEGLPVIQEKNADTVNELTITQEKNTDIANEIQNANTPVEEAIAVAKELPETKKETEPEMNGKEFSSDEDDDDDVEEQEKDAKSVVEASTNTMNADSGLAEDSREKKKADPFDAVEDGKLVDFIQVPGFMICVEAADGRLGSLVWGPQGLHVHCLQFTHVEYDIVIRDNILSTMISSKNPTVFLELTADQTIIGRVYIKLWGHLRRAQNFLSLCLGDQGKSYMNTKFLQVYNVGGSGERMLGGDYESNNGRGGKGLLDDLEWNGDYAMPMKAGMITAAGSGQTATNSLFLICTQSDASRNFSCPFGLVCEGLKVVKDAVQQTATKQIWITDCGVVIVPPSFESSTSS